ncbi:carboxypeptidase-like regulatory domain-containing protein [Maribacter algarum]|uniref:Carboxypeptidase-like regulatory domain-containing protein n=1 Tax=Maribacter algarum (ex Zhang et al. 2020) TaxID=2578118 RepID=A0A5S3PG78_9FLAO|nr:carboxypeptidase-like regulatory domain-containing protein [Maribacter algarum]TMM53133.1 carboxypeptidase-like regulatory domain-containing protein [Maribacter algarum]
MQKRVTTIMSFLLLLLVFSSALAQQREYIIGKLLDAKTQEPVAFASIRIKDRALGIISNTDGSFKIPLKYKEYGDIIEISSMGYQTQEILIQDFSIYELNNVRLQPAIFELQEAIVSAKKKRKLTAKQIVRRAIRAIPENYPLEPFSTVGYYRDYQLDSLRQYVNLNEAILEVFDQGFDATDSVTTKVRIYDYSENTDFKRDTSALRSYNYNANKRRKVIEKAFLPAYGGNEFNILRVHDAVRNYDIDSYSFVHRLKSDLISEHQFKKEADTYFDGEPLYTIGFTKFLLNYSAYGKLHISKDDFAIHKLEYSVYDRNKKRGDGNLNKHENENELIFETNTEYRKNSTKMYLSHISFHNTFKLWDPPKFVPEYIIPDFELKCFVIGFNNKVILEDASSLDNYEVKVKGKSIELGKAELLDSQNVVRLYPKMYPNRAEKMLREIEIAARKRKITNALFEIKISNIRDFEGNLINQWTSRDFNQFREFFAQELKTSSFAPVDALYMKRQNPIFKDQPIVKPENFNDYWMNTPLQNIDN